MAISDTLEEPYFAVRCPFQKVSKKDGRLYPCNRVCVEVRAGSSGRARCRSCHLRFEFEVDDQAKLSTGVRVRKTEEPIED